MQHDVGTATSRPPVAPGTGVTGSGEPPRDRRRRPEIGREMATPLAATFLGLLLVHNLLPAHATGWDEGDPGGAPPDGPGADDLDGSTTGPLAASLPSADRGPHAAAGTAGASVDLTALTGLAGFDGLQIAAVAMAPQGMAASVTGSGTAESGAGAGLLATGAPVALVPDLTLAGATDASGEEDLGPIGRYVRGDGSDGTVVLTDGDDIFVGGDGDEHVVGGAGDDYLDGAGGDDHLEGGTGDDTLLGGSGDDLLEGNAGDDLLDGGTGDDTLLGGSGDDDLLGGGGDDFLNGGTGIDRLQGGTGNEILVLADIRDALTELGLGVDGGGNDTVVVADSYAASLQTALAGTGGRATFVLGRPDIGQFPADVAGFRQQIDPDIENIRLEGSRAHDVVGDDRASLIIGNAGANRIHAAGGDDSVLGGAGNDWIDGGDGDDWLDGGQGADTLYGGAGDDVFVFGLHEDGDMIFDHEGRNTLRVAGADPTKLQLEMQGDDLVVRHDGAVLATVDGYATHADNYAGIDLGDGVRPMSDFMPEPGAGMASAALAAEDWLADYVPEATGVAEPLPEPWSGLEETWEPAPSVAGGEPAAMPVLAEPGGEPFQPTFQAGGDAMAMADLWLPVDDLAELPAEPAAADRLGEDRPAA